MSEVVQRNLLHIVRNLLQYRVLSKFRCETILLSYELAIFFLEGNCQMLNSNTGTIKRKALKEKIKWNHIKR